MIRAGSGISMIADTEEAARAASIQALASIRTPVADVAFLFATTPHAQRLGLAARVVKELTLTRHLVGCLGLGVFTMNAEVEGGAGLAVLLIASDGELLATPFLEAGAEDPEASERVGATVGRKLRGQRDGLLVVLPDVRAFRPTPFFEGLRMELGDLPVVGGASCDDGSLGKAFQLCGGSVQSGAVAGVMLSGAFKKSVMVSHACVPCGRPFTVTSSQGHFLLGLGGRKALDCFMEFVEQRFGGDLRAAAQHAVVAISEPSDVGSYYVRQIVGIVPDQRIVAVTEPVASGLSVAFTVREPEGATKSLAFQLQRVEEERRSRESAGPPAFGLYFNCAARTSAFYGHPSPDTGLIRKTLGEFPLAGFYGGAEIAPLVGENRVNYYSGVLVLGDQADAEPHGLVGA